MPAHIQNLSAQNSYRPAHSHAANTVQTFQALFFRLEQILVASTTTKNELLTLMNVAGSPFSSYRTINGVIVQFCLVLMTTLYVQQQLISLTQVVSAYAV